MRGSLLERNKLYLCMGSTMLTVSSVKDRRVESSKLSPRQLDFDRAYKDSLDQVRQMMQ
jgi:hypothetical protein